MPPIPHTALAALSMKRVLVNGDIYANYCCNLVVFVVFINMTLTLDIALKIGNAVIDTARVNKFAPLAVVVMDR